MLGIAMSIYLLVLSREDENVVYRVYTEILLPYSLQRASKFRALGVLGVQGFQGCTPRVVPLALGSFEGTVGD